MHCFSSFASVLLVSQIVTVVKLSLSRDSGEAGLTVDSCLSGGDTNEQNVFPIPLGFKTCFFFAYNENCSTVEIMSACAKNTDCII